MKLTGQVTKVFEKVSGQGQNGTWSKQTFILKTDDDHPTEVAIDIWNDKVEVNTGQNITAFINIGSREYNEKWYTNVMAWKVEAE